jgi:hypothetical protein
MSARARIDSMRPKRPGSTRTAPPRMPDLYDAGYLPYTPAARPAARGFRLGSRAASGSTTRRAWRRTRAPHPLYILFHAAMLAMAGSLRFRLFPKTQPRDRPSAHRALLPLRTAFVIATLVALVLGVRSVKTLRSASSR